MTNILLGIIELPRALTKMRKTDRIIKDIIDEKGLIYFSKHKEQILRSAGL
ncbi:hypothetical protein GW756_04290 [bacterium]|nr:hypothetical protein [bacterium]NCQ55181.1 hypothetical protein [Candidatus Parcubacteria bacterium]NCS67306.1 hypothetical protein [Candidatus Peregrinibacteria bacterium]NCS96561.1 hypothetical protein [bacterium]